MKIHLALAVTVLALVSPVLVDSVEARGQRVATRAAPVDDAPVTRRAARAPARASVPRTVRAQRAPTRTRVVTRRVTATRAVASLPSRGATRVAGSVQRGVGNGGPFTVTRLNGSNGARGTFVNGLRINDYQFRTGDFFDRQQDASSSQ